MISVHVLLVALALATAAAERLELSAVAAALDRQEFAPAQRRMEPFVRLHPSSVPARILLARSEMGLNRGTAALEQLRTALRLDPTSVEALYYVSKLAGVMSQQAFSDVVRLAPDSARTHQLRGDALEARGDAAGAEREYLAALERRPRTAYIMNALGDLKRHAKDYAAALPWYEKVLAKDPGNYDALYGAGACKRLSRAFAEAIPFFRRALAADPSSVAAKMALGESLVLTGQAVEAVPLLEAAARVDPHIRRLQYLLGRAYQATGRPKDAEGAFARYRGLFRSYLDESDSASEDNP